MTEIEVMVVALWGVHCLICTENCIVFATTGHARFEHARVLNNKMRAIPGFWYLLTSDHPTIPGILAVKVCIIPVMQ